MGVYSTEYIQSRYLGGASSYSQQLSEAVQQGLNQKLYVPTHRGLFKGQSLVVSGVAGGYGKPYDYVTVKELGLDAGGPYFVADDLKYDHPAKAMVYNKNVVNGLTVEDTSNCDNQSMSLIVRRSTYGVGDTFGISMRLFYQGDIISGGGDEAGVGISSQIHHDLECFRGEVESWNLPDRELVYKPGKKLNPQKLGTSRPLINMNADKWITDGKVRVTPTARSDSRIIGTPDVGWDQSVVGRFIAIDDPSEYYGPADGIGLEDIVRRWWHITALEDGENGYMHLYVLKPGNVLNTRTGPTLFRYENYTTDTNTVDLDYIIAPGAWVSDVRNAVAGNTPGFIGEATANDKRTLVLAPSPPLDGTPLFEQGDPIINPPGSAPYLPTAFRARHWDYYPGSIKGASFTSRNYGKVQLQAGLFVHGPGGTVDEVKAKQKDGEVTFETGVYIFAATSSAIRIRGPVQLGAIDLWQPEGNEQKIRWFRMTIYMITDDTLQNLPSEGIPPNILQQLEGLQNQGFYGKEEFLDALKTTIGEQQTDTYKDLILKHVVRITASPSTLHARPDNGNFVFTGGDIDHMNKGSIKLKGLSATDTPAQNLRDFNVPVAVGETQLNITFPVAETDDKYAVIVECSWITNKAVKDKATTGFTVEFDQPAPAGAKLDWLLIR